ncbi:MAG: UvrD-helicase domain-containing protein [Patescibacteria group bacterium]
MNSTDTLLASLNDKQREAVTATDGPVLIIAGPGSGKTRTLTARVAFLMARGVSAHNIIAVTFTNKAAEEMKNRIGDLLRHGQDNPQFGQPEAVNREQKILPFVGTFHALAVRILRQNAERVGFTPQFAIFDADDALGVVKDAMRERDINPKQFAPGLILHTISTLKNELTTPERYGEEYGTEDLFPRAIQAVYSLYVEKLRAANAMDFDDLLMQTNILFETHPDILGVWQKRIRYLLVDEYQDTNHSQYMIVRKLAALSRNITVVGDDAQAIYRFRGADYQNILNFERDWPDARVIVLDQNYRSTQTILDAAGAVIAKNRLQKQKRLWTDHPGGESIAVIAAENEDDEARRVCRQIRDAVRKGHHPWDIAALYRTNAQSRALEEALLDEKIPYILIGGVRFYERKEVKDIVAYLRVLTNYRDVISLKRIINVPERGIGEKSFPLFLAFAKTQSAYGGAPTLTGSRREIAFREVARLLNRFRSALTTEKSTALLKAIVQDIGYRKYLEDHFTNAEERWDNVQEFLALAQKYDALPPPTGVERLLEDVALLTDAETAAADKNAVRLMTLHAAKGLEFDVVFLVGMEEGILPHARSLASDADLEEERRLCYVGITRARRKVYCSFAESRAQFGSIQINAPSRFLREIPEHLLEMDEAEKIIQI